MTFYLKGCQHCGGDLYSESDGARCLQCGRARDWRRPAESAWLPVVAPIATRGRYKRRSDAVVR